ncbi:MAG: FHA domain-containing protein [Planctomycetota bacterium]
MAAITLRVLDGADRGHVYDSLAPPITIGREEGNAVQLNDERISRFHIKIQEDQDKVVLTDLESTNGTRVNGEETQLRILRFGDVISVGRSVLLYGTREQIASRLDEVRAEGVPSVDSGELDAELDELAEHASSGESSSFDFELKWSESEQLRSTLHLPAPPEPPEGLSPGQAAQFSEVLEYLHLRSRALVQSVTMGEGEERVTFDLEQWQELLDIQSLLAEYLRKVGDPGGE